MNWVWAGTPFCVCRAVNRSGIETISQHDVLYVHPISICSPLQAMLQHAVIAPYHDYYAMIEKLSTLGLRLMK